MSNVDAANPAVDEHGGLWSDLLDSSRLKQAGLKMETLAEQVGVSAAYLRLVRQGKRSPSTETAERLFAQLGYRVETHETEAGTDFVATDDKGDVRHWTAKTSRGGGSSVERALMQQILDKTTTLEERTTWLDVWEARYRGEEPPPVAHEGSPEPSEGRRLLWWLRDKDPLGAPAAGAASGMVVMGLAAAAGSAPATSTARARLAKLLQSLPSEDLPLAEAYLTLLVDRAKGRSARTAEGTVVEDGPLPRGE